MPKKKSIYCYQCGTKNDIQNAKCTKCKTRLEEEDHEISEYLKEKLFGTIKDDLTDRMSDYLVSFIKKHLYGILMAISITFAGVAFFVRENVGFQNDRIDYTNESYKYEAMLESVPSCDDDYQLEEQICYKMGTSPAERTATCQTGYVLSGNTCVSRENYDKIETKTCEVTPEYAYHNDATPIIENGECFLDLCGYRYQTDEESGDPNLKAGDCAMGTFEQVEFTVRQVCPSGTREIGGNCKRTSTPKETFSCSNGTLQKDKCLERIETEPSPACEEGYTYNELVKYCIKD